MNTKNKVAIAFAIAFFAAAAIIGLSSWIVYWSNQNHDTDREYVRCTLVTRDHQLYLEDCDTYR